MRLWSAAPGAERRPRHLLYVRLRQLRGQEEKILSVRHLHRSKLPDRRADRRRVKVRNLAPATAVASEMRPACHTERGQHPENLKCRTVKASGAPRAACNGDGLRRTEPPGTDGTLSRPAPIHGGGHKMKL